MSQEDAAELRRQKILKNKEKRLELLLGIQNSTTISTVDSFNLLNDTDSKQQGETAHLPDRIAEQEDSFLVRRAIVAEQQQTITTTLINPSKSSASIKIETNIALKKCHFTGFSNLEIALLFTIATVTTLLFYLEMSDIIYNNALLPFATFELAHLIVHFNYLPSTSSQLQMFTTLLRLCGIPQSSLKNLITILNFLFILIDNFVIYLFSFAVSSVCIHVLLEIYSKI